MLDMRNIEKKNVELYLVQPHTDKLISEFLKSEPEVSVLQKSGKKHLDKLQKWSIISSVVLMKRAALIVGTPKSDGSLRCCGCNKATVNPI